MARSSLAAMASIAMIVILSCHLLCLAAPAYDVDAADACPVHITKLSLDPINSLCSIGNSDLCCQSMQTVGMEAVDYNPNCVDKLVAAIEAYTGVTADEASACLQNEGRGLLEQLEREASGAFAASGSGSLPAPSLAL
ncbi:hypothetical protein CBR_g20057 [Chara braunii]|uniref:Bifunctional inhibitor/plant lipid transfer protein/seed storage helical domain-containing protein n=1 Tax=Chara braunii TaxID=69332 RepID=A0A388KZD9_CHABU|nr:hypothetical protein CBR_g20057 [Chara braunii]|eukprot:GBG75427.1 hypothetical protein CBR_g20057 [Chara braunii]